MKRGDIWWVNFDPSVGGEIRKTRPAVIISNNSSNKHLNRIQVIPLTSNTKKLYPCECYIRVDGKLSKAMADQVMTVSKTRLTTKIAAAQPDEIQDIERILALQLGFPTR